MRKQYHFRPSESGLMAWDVDRLVTLTKDFPRIHVPLTSIRELDEPFWFSGDNTPTCRAVVEHARLIEAVDLAFPDRKSTRLNSSHLVISYAVFCLKKKKTI